ADPVLFDLSPALLDRAPLRAVVVSRHRVCSRIFRSLHITRRLATERVVGARRFCDLPVAGVCAGNITGNVVHPICRAPLLVSSPWRVIHNGISPLPCCTATLPRTLPLHLCRFRYGHVLHVGNCRNRWAHFASSRASQAFLPRRCLFLWPVSHSPVVRHLARTSHSRSADLDVFIDLYPDPGGTQRVGHALGKNDKLTGEQTRLAEKTRTRLAEILKPGRHVVRDAVSF